MTDELYPRTKPTPDPALGLESSTTVWRGGQLRLASCTCDSVDLVHVALTGGEVPPCDVHRPADGHHQPHTPALNSPQIEATIAAALGATPEAL